MYDDQVVAVQSRLTALQTRGRYDEQTVPPASQRFHSSLIEFTMNRPGEAGDPLTPYLINPRMAHQSVAEGCLRLSQPFPLIVQRQPAM